MPLVEAEQAGQFDMPAGFFEGFARRCVRERLQRLEMPGRLVQNEPAVGDFLDRMAAAPAAAEGIRTVRKMLGLTQGELGKRLGVDDSTVSRWERGEKRMSDKSMRALVEQMASLDGVPVPSPPVQISGEGLRKLRGLMRLSREDFAQKIGVSPRTVSLYEGRREVPKACAKRVAMVALEYGINLSAAA